VIKDTGKVINVTNNFYEDGGGIYALDTIGIRIFKRRTHTCLVHGFQMHFLLQSFLSRA